MTIPRILTPRLILRAFTEGDVDSLHCILSGEGVLRYFPRTDPPSRERVQRLVMGILSHWQERGYGLWAVESQSNGELIGRCGLQYLPDTEEVEVDFVLGKTFWGHGFATEAGRASLRYGFEDLKLARVVGIVHTENAASKRVLEKLGLEVVEQRDFWGMDCYRYAIEGSAYDKASRAWENAS